MRIMTGDATDARICSVETSAVREAKRLEAHVYGASPLTSYDHVPRSVTLSAKIRYVLGRQLAQIRWSSSVLPLGRVNQVGGGTFVAVFAGHAWL
jgi:hypothetical protein